MPPLSDLSRVQHFAATLDRCDFDEARNHIAEDCRYELGGQVLVGPETIIASYRESAEWGSRVLEQVVYESDVQPAEDGFAVLYTDRITQGGETVAYRSRQHIWLSRDGQVSRIVHEELPGEREKLDAFFARHGIRR